MTNDREQAEAVIAEATEEQIEEYRELFGLEAGDDLAGSMVEFMGGQWDITPTSIADAGKKGWIAERTTDDEDAVGLANWAVRNIVNARKKAAAIRRIAAAERKRIDDWEEQQLKKPAHTEQFFTGIAEQYMDEYEPDEKSVPMPCGARLRKKYDRPHIQWDDEAARAYAEREKLTECLQTSVKRAPLKTLLTKVGNQYALTATGEVVPFVETIPASGDYQFSIEDPKE